MRALIQGFDTIECAYYLTRRDDCTLDFEAIAFEQDLLVRAKSKSGSILKLGNEEFLLASHGIKSGYPYLMENEAFIIQFGEFNKPNFFVKFRSIALWHQGAEGLHRRFLAWADSVGLMPYRSERLSRVDYAFDYHLLVIDFDENSFLSQAEKDNKFRKNRKSQTFRFGTDQIVLRVYHKSDEVKEASKKIWLFDLWGMEENVWRIEWQARKDTLRAIGIISFDSLLERQGDLLRLLCKDHTTLRIKTQDSNRSRWPLHPLWLDLIERVNAMEGLGVVRELDQQALLEERLTRIAISVYGYAKRVAAIDQLYTGQRNKSHMDEALDHLFNRISEIHDPLTWQQDVDRRVKEMRFGEW